MNHSESRYKKMLVGGVIMVEGGVIMIVDGVMMIVG